MSLIHRIERQPLADFVDFLWLSQGYAQPHAAERVLPTGTMSMVLSLDGAASARDVLCGARTRSFVLDTSKPLSLVGVCFKPGGGFPFFNGPVVELQDLSVPLDTLWGPNAHTLRERLLEARTAPARFHILEGFLLEQVRRRPERHPAVRYAIDAFQATCGTSSVAAVTERTGLTARRFIEAFRHEVGLTPKVFCRLARFRGAVGDAFKSTGSVDWVQVALSSGYYDQAHFIHDFREFAGVSPSAWLRRRTASPNHVRLPA
ncbi:MAG: helix-turn-helix domain-containing protein [Gammaproteobacteria bacterium]